MKPIAARLNKIAGMPPAEWRERGRQLLLKSGERFLRLHQGELKVEGRVDELVRQYECNLEQVFLKVVGYQQQS